MEAFAVQLSDPMILPAPARLVFDMFRNLGFPKGLEVIDRLGGFFNHIFLFFSNRTLFILF